MVSFARFGFVLAWGAGDFLNVALSPQGDRLAVSVNTAGVAQVWVKELPGGPLTRVTFGSGRADRPAWTPDGQRIAYIASDTVGRNYGRIVRADGSSPAPDTLLVTEEELWEIVIPDDGGGILFRVGNSASNADVGYADIEADTAQTLLLNSPFSEHTATLSPDGRSLAYVSNRSGRDEVYVRPFPEVGTDRVQVSRNGGNEPLWSHSGRELFYQDGEGWMTAASVGTAPEFRVIARERLFDARAYRHIAGSRTYDVARDDRRFVMLRTGPVEGTGVLDMILVENWFAEVRKAIEGR